jgi:16S rRNA (uracil1498-N3)-methyltransferase
MQLPFFYINPSFSSEELITMDEDNSRHVIQVLRMREGEQMNLTDGLGMRLRAAIVDEHKKHCQVRVLERSFEKRKAPHVTIAISLLKNTARFEWFLEKASELGVEKIIPLVCERTEKQRFRMDRLQTICTSAMLQSQQCWLPLLLEPEKYNALKKWKGDGIHFIAHCEDQHKEILIERNLSSAANRLIAIGPEGDFTADEISTALQEGFIPVSLGDNRLRTETAGVVAAILLRSKA